MKKRATAILAGAVLSFFVPQAKAQDASFGCKVLLCAAASNPSWTGISYCVPVMQQLFSSLRHGGSWPTCDQANASPLTYQPYNACPSGMNAYTMTNSISSTKAQQLTPSSEGSLCASPNNPSVETAIARELNPKPYSVTLSPPGSQPFTFIFALQ